MTRHRAVLVAVVCTLSACQFASDATSASKSIDEDTADRRLLVYQNYSFSTFATNSGRRDKAQDTPQSFFYARVNDRFHYASPEDVTSDILGGNYALPIVSPMTGDLSAKEAVYKEHPGVMPAELMQHALVESDFESIFKRTIGEAVKRATDLPQAGSATREVIVLSGGAPALYTIKRLQQLNPKYYRGLDVPAVILIDPLPPSDQPRAEKLRVSLPYQRKSGNGFVRHALIFWTNEEYKNRYSNYFRDVAAQCGNVSKVVDPLAALAPIPGFPKEIDVDMNGYMNRPYGDYLKYLEKASDVPNIPALSKHIDAIEEKIRQAALADLSPLNPEAFPEFVVGQHERAEPKDAPAPPPPMTEGVQTHLSSSRKEKTEVDSDLMKQALELSGAALRLARLSRRETTVEAAEEVFMALPDEEMLPSSKQSHLSVMERAGKGPALAQVGAEYAQRVAQDLVNYVTETDPVLELHLDFPAGPGSGALGTDDESAQGRQYVELYDYNVLAFMLAFMSDTPGGFGTVRKLVRRIGSEVVNINELKVVGGQQLILPVDKGLYHTIRVRFPEVASNLGILYRACARLFSIIAYCSRYACSAEEMNATADMHKKLINFFESRYLPINPEVSVHGDDVFAQFLKEFDEFYYQKGKDGKPGISRSIMPLETKLKEMYDLDPELPSIRVPLGKRDHFLVFQPEHYEYVMGQEYDWYFDYNNPSFTIADDDAASVSD